MGNIPEFRRSSLQQTAQPSLVQSAGAEYRALAGVADTAMQLAFEQKKANDMAFASTQSIDFEVQAKQAYFNWQRENEADPLNKDAQRKLKEGLSSKMNELASTAPSSAAADGFKRMSENITGQIMGHGVGWANEQNVKNISDKHYQSNDLLATETFKVGNDAAINEALKNHETLRESGKVGAGPNWATEFDIKGRRNIVAAGIDGMIDQGKFGMAQRALKNKEYTDALGSDETKRLFERMLKKEKTVAELSENVLAKKQTDTWEYQIARHNVKNASQLPGYTPMDFSARAFELRQRMIDGWDASLGTKAKLLSPSEETELVERIKRGNPRDQAYNLSQLNTNLTKDQVVRLGKQLYEKDPAVGVAFALAAEDPFVSEKIISGDKLLTSKGLEKPRSEDLNESFNAYVGNAVPNERARGMIKAGVEALLVKNMDAQGKSPKDASDADFKKAMEEIVGPQVTLNGGRTLSFRKADGKFLSEDELDDVTASLTEEDFPNGMPTTDSGLPLTISQVRNDVKFQQVGDGQYLLINSVGKTYGDKFGNDIVVNLKKTHQRGAQKRSFFDKVKNLEFSSGPLGPGIRVKK